MELGGFEPPTSWVRSAPAILAVGAKSGLLPACLPWRLSWPSYTYARGLAAISGESATSGEKWLKWGGAVRMAIRNEPPEPQNGSRARSSLVKEPESGAGLGGALRLVLSRSNPGGQDRAQQAAPAAGNQERRR